MLLSFDGQLLGCKDGEFTPDTGRNAGTTYKWLDLEFHNREYGSFTLKADADIVVDPAQYEKPLHWDLVVEPRLQKGKTTFRVTGISGGKVQTPK